jgi:hypothetical protein
MVLAAALFGVPPQATGNPVEPLTIVVVVVDHAQIPERALTRAKAEAARIYRTLRINLVWSHSLGSSVQPWMIVNIVSRPIGATVSVPESLAAKSADWQVLGVAPGHKERRDLVAWAFYERILDTATLLGLDPGLLLGHVIAHEMGHLLLPYDTHSQTGLMRAGWNKSQAANAVVGTLTFNPDEFALIRRTMAGMVAGGQSSPGSSSTTPHAPQPEDLSSSDRAIGAR